VVPSIGYVQRWADTFVDGLLDEEPAILLEGPRGSGKSTLLRAIAARRDAMVIDLDDSSVLRLVHEDADAALASPGLVVIDEFHRAPEVLSVIKRVVDRQGGAGSPVGPALGTELLSLGFEAQHGSNSHDSTPEGSFHGGNAGRVFAEMPRPRWKRPTRRADFRLEGLAAASRVVITLIVISSSL
jgi:hypothetical protein